MPKKIYMSPGAKPEHEVDNACALELIDARKGKHKATPLKGQPKAIASILSREIKDLRIISKHRPLNEAELTRLSIIARIDGILAQAHDKLNQHDNAITPEELSDAQLEQLAK